MFLFPPNLLPSCRYLLIDLFIFDFDVCAFVMAPPSSFPLCLCLCSQKGLKNVFDEAILAALEPPEPKKKRKCVLLWDALPPTILPPPCLHFQSSHTLHWHAHILTTHTQTYKYRVTSLGLALLRLIGRQRSPFQKGKMRMKVAPPSLSSICQTEKTSNKFFSLFLPLQPKAVASVAGWQQVELTGTHTDQTLPPTPTPRIQL